MLDFLTISTRPSKRGTIEIYPKFIINNKSTDLMIRGGDFYAVWVEERGLWSTDEQDVISMVDRELDRYAEENSSRFDANIKVMHMWDSDTGIIDKWHKFCQRQMRDSFHMLDEKLIFSNIKSKKTDYASKSLTYPLEEGKIDAYDKLMSVLYLPEERHKIEWAIGSIINGDSKKIQKFLVLYGASGTGKSTVLNIVEQLFAGYFCVFDARSLGSANSAFALEAFKDNPLVAIQHDGDLSHIEDNTRLNSLVSHEMMTVNEKFKSTYANRFKCFLFMGTNKPVKITDAKSGLIRRLIDVSPSGEKVGLAEYNKLTKQITFELGAIAWHCQKIYSDNPEYYDDYIPLSMLGASNDFYNFVLDSYHIFKKEDGVSAKQAWEMYNTYCDQAKVPYPLSQRAFREELKNYFREFQDRVTDDDGNRLRSYYSGFRSERFGSSRKEKQKETAETMIFEEIESIFDKEYADCLAQYASDDGKPLRKWANVKTTLAALDTSRMHYVKLPENHIVIDFDIKDESGKKSFGLNAAAANKFPPTYAELSKSGEGIHLHYIYNGDPSMLSRIYADDIEIKVFTGNSSLRRKLTKCNNLPVATISSGLPFKKGESKMVNFDSVKSEKGLRSLIDRNLRKEIHPGTKPSIDFIYKILEDAYEDGLQFDVTDMRNGILAFAAGSTHQADYCIKMVNKMRFKSDDMAASKDNDKTPIIFYDVEVFPNLFLINWKAAGPKEKVVRMINPKPDDIENLLKYRLVGFNCRRYDNHIIYACMMGYDNMQLYKLSQKIISGEKNVFFGEAYNLSYTDIYDFAAKKQSLKKWEIELGIHHQELGLPWDQPVPEELWPKVAEYCDNDVLATEAVFDHLQGDFTARQILADVAGLSVNDTTNTLTTRIIFGNNRHPQPQFSYRDMGDENEIKDRVHQIEPMDSAFGALDSQFSAFDSNGRPIFPGYTFESNKSIYRGEEVGEGGYVYAEPGMYSRVALLDIASMHPSSIVAEELFGREYTKRFKDILDARIAIKHKDFDKARKMLGGVLAKYLDDEGKAKELAQALKIAINSVYGLTAATFENPFKDPRNRDNIVAKRGALFMVNLKHEVQKRGFTVAHIKTDSIKIPNATPEIIKFVTDYGKLYGYNFEHEATYDRMCLVNDAVYIARYDNGEWTATGTQFQVPYVFKKLFSHESIKFEDLCETKSVTSSLYLDMNEGLTDVTEDEKEYAKLETKYKKGQLSDTTWEEEAGRLFTRIQRGHKYVFVGKVGQFCPIKDGRGGGLLLREKDGKYYAATGSKGYRWLESEMVKISKKEKDIDESYYIALVDEAVDTISKYGDFEQFVSDEPYSEQSDLAKCINVPEGMDEETPF